MVDALVNHQFELAVSAYVLLVIGFVVLVSIEFLLDSIDAFLNSPRCAPLLRGSQRRKLLIHVRRSHDESKSHSARAWAARFAAAYIHDLGGMGAAW